MKCNSYQFPRFQYIQIRCCCFEHCHSPIAGRLAGEELAAVERLAAVGRFEDVPMTEPREVVAVLSNIQFVCKVVSARRNPNGMTDPVDRVTATTPVGGTVILTIRFPCL